MKRPGCLDWSPPLAPVMMPGMAFTWTKVAVTEVAPALVVGARLAIGAVSGRQG